MNKTALILAISLTGCSWFSSKATATEAAFVSCAKADITANAAGIAGSVLEEVTKILVSGTDGWQSDLDALAAEAGADVVACAIESVREVFLAQANVGSGVSTSESSPVIERADVYLSNHGVRFAPSK